MWFNTITKKGYVRVKQEPFHETELQQMTSFIPNSSGSPQHSSTYSTSSNFSGSPQHSDIQYPALFIIKCGSSINFPSVIWALAGCYFQPTSHQGASACVVSGSTQPTYVSHNSRPLRLLEGARGYLPVCSAPWALLQPGNGRRGALRNHPLVDLFQLILLALPCIHI